MGTILQVTVECAEPACERAFEVVSDTLALVDEKMSVYHASEITRINDTAGTHDFMQPISAETHAVLATSLDVARRSNGVFDPTILPLLKVQRLFREDFGTETTDAGVAAVNAARALVDYRQVKLTTTRAGLRRAGMALDLGGIAKGYALDLIAKQLRAQGVKLFSLNFGGHLLVHGLSVPTTVFDPNMPTRPLAKCTLTSGSLSVSAQDKRYVTSAGKRRGHLLHPKTGKSETKSQISLVYHSSAMLADAWSTALFLLHEAEFEQLANAEKIAALHVDVDAAPVISPALKRLNICNVER